jgi:hypothetical protein
MWHEYNNIPFWISTTNVLPKSRIFKFLKRDCGTIPVAEITSGIIIIIIIMFVLYYIILLYYVY